jgi:hypothetical protein
MKKMYPHAETRANYKYPRGGLMQLRYFVKDGELRRPTMLDANGEQCLIVVKNGATTGVTLGRATDIESFVREYKDYAMLVVSCVDTFFGGFPQCFEQPQKNSSPWTAFMRVASGLDLVHVLLKLLVHVTKVLRIESH